MAEETRVASIDHYPQLNLPPCDLKVRESEGRVEVLDVVRKRYVALTPEEWVRQHVVHTLIHTMNYPMELMQVEGTIKLNELTRRCDIVVYGRQMVPKMIVECKMPQVALTQKVLDQACRYNTVLKVPYLYITNGLQHVVLRVESEKGLLVQLENMPSWDRLR